ncbi:MAG: hypothetical protein VXW14_03965 [Candidatus Thermoplasmatota archaeon]|nr:hypothetical protein [Candidatus Thermoplasmatota archaeon]
MFLTSRLRDLLIGGFRIRDRRRKPDEPFNPFAANANQVRQKKRNERSQNNAPSTSGQGRNDSRPNIDADDFRKKQEEARKKLGAQSSPTAPMTQQPAINANTLNAKADNQAVQQVSRADRLAELRKQSQESVKKTESILEPETPASTPAPQAIVEDVIEKQEPVHIEENTVIESDFESTVEEKISSKNVFKQIVTNTPKKRESRRRRSRHDDSGGGRQPKVKKLNRQKYNDYKYAARDILDDDRVADEHRSNLLGQIWAKGERIGVEATLEFISEKEEQLIINEEIAQRLRDLVKALTTRR